MLWARFFFWSLAGMFFFGTVPVSAFNNSGGAFSFWPDTGRNICFDATTAIPCPSPGDPFYGQDAQYDGPPRSYTVLANGAVVRDNVTGLSWEIKNAMDGTVDYSNPNDADNLYVWCDPDPTTNGGDQGYCSDPAAYDTSEFIAALNSANYGGYNDWRLPTVNELATLVDYNRLYPKIHPLLSEMQPGSTNGYSTATSSAAFPTTKAWVVSFRSGGGGTGTGFKMDGRYVRAVRGGQAPTGTRFVDTGNGTVTDQVTCLEWQKTGLDVTADGSPDKLTWEEALAAAEALSLAGKNDWRLPSINELYSIVDHGRNNPAVDPIIFPTDPSPYWTSTTSQSFDRAFTVNFDEGNSGRYGKTSKYYARAVRGVPCGTGADPVDNGNNAGGAFSAWPDTGQKTFYDAAGPVRIPAPGDAFFGQDAQYACLNRSYTTLASGAVVRDNVTGLIWEVKHAKDGTEDYANPNDADNLYSWCDPDGATNGGQKGYCTDNDPTAYDSNEFLAALNNAGYGGYNDWRLPTAQELATLVDYDRRYAAIDPLFSGTKDNYYRAATSRSFGPGFAWTIRFDFGALQAFSKNDRMHLRAVRGGTVPTGTRFTDNGDGTVTDQVTGLQWQQAGMDIDGDGTPDLLTWQEALAAGEALNLAGKDDWRLPSINELLSIVDTDRAQPAVAFRYFPTNLSPYWSSTSSVNKPARAWGVQYAEGGVTTYSKAGTEKHYVRAVRGGACRQVLPFPWPMFLPAVTGK